MKLTYVIFRYESVKCWKRYNDMFGLVVDLVIVLVIYMYIYEMWFYFMIYKTSNCVRIIEPAISTIYRYLL